MCLYQVLYLTLLELKYDHGLFSSMYLQETVSSDRVRNLSVPIGSE